MNDAVTEYGAICYIHEYLSLLRESTGEFVISDRSLLDLFAYVTASVPCRLSDQFLAMLEELVFFEAQTVYTFIYVPIEFDLPYDNVRPEDQGYQRSIDKRIHTLLRHFGVPSLTVHGTLEERVGTVKELLFA